MIQPLIAWLGLLLATGSVDRAALPPRTTLTLSVCDVQALPLDAAALRAEVESVLASAGVAIRWRRVEAGVGGEDEAGAVSVRLLATARGRLRPEPVLGAVAASGARQSPIWVFVDDVRAQLAGRERFGLMDAAERRQVSIALGRIVAHEVVHTLAPSQPHSVAGLMARAVDRRVLENAGVGLDPVSASAVREALGRGSAPLPPSVAASGGLAVLGAAH